MQLTLRDGQWAVSDEGQSGPPESPAILFMATFGGQKREKEKILAQKQLVLIDDVYNIRILRMRFFFNTYSGRRGPRCLYGLPDGNENLSWHMK